MSTVSPVLIPYCGRIPGGMQRELEIEIHGTVPYFAKQGFSINLCHGPMVNSTTLLHFNPRFHQQCVVRNTFENCQWGVEERDNGMPFQTGQAFDLRIKAKPNVFEIKVNDQHFADFSHRLPKEMAQFLVIDGEVSVDYIHFHGTALTAMTANQAELPESEPLYWPQVPFKMTIPGRLIPGRKICISGIPFYDCSRFSVNLQSGLQDNSDIVFHFDSRINYENDHNIIVRNHCQGGHWGPEERHAPYFPFKPSVNFDLTILVEAASFQVAVNNQHLLEFSHRLPVQDASVLSVVGQVHLTVVHFQ